MKKIIGCMLCICLILTGCAKEKNTAEEKNAGKEKTVSTESTALYPLIEGKKLILKDLSGHKIVNQYRLGKKQCADSIMKLNKGYCVRIYTADRELRNQTVQGMTVEDTPDDSEIVNVSIKFFDKHFRETDTVDISKLAKERKNEDFLTSNFTVSPDGSKIAWDAGKNILVYDRKTKKFAEYSQISGKDIVAENITFAGNDKLAFYGSKGADEKDTCYGYLNLTDKKLDSFVEKNYEAFSLYADANYIWLNDGENPEGTASGEMPVIDIRNGKKQVVHLDNIESTKARITEDGKYIIAVSQTKEKNFRVRQYDAGSGKILNEKKYEYKESVHVNDIISINEGKICGVIYSTDKGDKIENYEIIAG